jgi:hypothetical protein
MTNQANPSDPNDPRNKLQVIASNRPCPICGYATEEITHAQFDLGVRVYEWRCTNANCKETTHWNLPCDHYGQAYLEKMRTAKRDGGSVA